MERSKTGVDIKKIPPTFLSSHFFLVGLSSEALNASDEREIAEKRIPVPQLSLLYSTPYNRDNCSTLFNKTVGQKMSSLPYSITERRSLTEEEHAIVLRLVAAACPDRLGEANALEVFARCGCGKCPTIMFHADPEKNKDLERIIADFQGGDADSGLVGIILWERDSQISELEAWSIDGKEISMWPPIETIRPLEIAHSR